MSGDYKPMMPESVARKLVDLHLQTVAAARRAKNVTVTRLGYTFVVPPAVFAPSPFALAELVQAEVRLNDRVLDMGTGSGINGIVAAAVSSDVVAVDLSLDAVECASENATRNNVADRVSVFQSDIFSAVSGRFNLIIFDPPFRWFKPTDGHETGMADENYEGLRRFFTQVDKFLFPDGRILIAFSTIGDLEYLKFLIEQADFSFTELRRIDNVVQGVEVSHFAYRLIRKS